MIGRLRLLWIAVAAFALALALAPFQLVAMGLGGRARGVLPRFWHRCVASLIGLRVEVVGAPAQGRVLLAANHQSWLDIVVLGSVLQASFVAKSEVRRWPVFGTLAWLQRTIFVERGRRRGVREQVGRIARRLDAGETLVLFAEGSTSDGNGVLPFKSSLFGAAHAALELSRRPGILVQPVCLAYTRHHGLPLGRAGRPKIAWVGDQTLFPHMSAVLRDGSFDVRVAFGQGIEFTAGSDRKAVASACRRAVAGQLADALHPRADARS